MKKFIYFLSLCFLLICESSLTAQIPFMSAAEKCEINTDDHLTWVVSTKDVENHMNLGTLWRGTYGFSNYFFSGTDGMLQAYTRNSNDLWSVWVTNEEGKNSIGIFRDVTFITPTFEIFSPNGVVLQLTMYHWYDTHYTLVDPNSDTIIGTLYGSLYFKDQWSLFISNKQFLEDNNFDFRLILLAVAHRMRIDSQ